MDVRDWLTTEEGLKRTVKFESFTALTAFLAELGPIADAADHHPDCVIRKAVVLDITLITHDKGRVTEKDVALAEQINSLLAA